MSVLPVDVHLEQDTATVRPRRRGPAAIAVRAERFRGTDAADALVGALRGARLLRTLRGVDLRIVLETADVLLEVPSPVPDPDDPPHRADRRLPVDQDGFAPPCTVRLGRGTVAAALDRRVATELGRALVVRRCAGTVRVQLGPLVRADRVLRSVAADRPDGLIVDATRAAVTLLVVRSGCVVRARAVPAGDLRAALLGAAAPLVGDLGRASLHLGRPGAPWLHVAAPDELVAGVRRACASMLVHGQVVDLLVLPGRRA